MLKKLGLHDKIGKLKEHEIEDPEIFWNLEEDDLIEHLDIKTHGKKFRFKESLKEIKKINEESLEKKEEEEDIQEQSPLIM